MNTRATVLLTLMVACFSAWAQQAAQPAKTPEKKDHMEGARELFYLAVAKKDPLPPIHKAAVRPVGATQPATVTATANPAPVPPIPTVSAAAPAMNLGLRYNLVLVDQQSGKSENVDSDKVLKHGDCFSLEFESNRSGYLYVLAKQSSGQWQPLLPSQEMTEESNIIDPGKRMRVPKSYCFEVNDPAGSETLFVVLSRNPSDFQNLSEGIKRQNAPATPSPVRRQVDTTQYADASMDKTLQQMRQQFGTRDIAIRKVNQPINEQEPAHSVYVVNTSDKPSSSVVTQIEVKHK
jgi:hypothetical protein